MVGIDLYPYGARTLSIDVHHGPERCDSLSERDRCPSVENAERLPGPVVNGHGGDDTLCCELGDLDAKRVGKTASG
jgi:hypothetical protein